MKKKSKVKVLMISAAVAAVSLFTVTAYASTSSTPGYDAFKEVLKANHMSGQTIESATINGDITVTVDGKTVLKADGTTKMKEAGDEHRISSDFDLTLMGVERSGSLYSSDEDKVYLVDRTHDLHYQVINVDDEHDNHHDWTDDDSKHRPMNRAEEALLDFVVGDLKDEFSVTNHTDGSKTITVDISKEEVPLPVRLLMNVVSAVDNNERTHAEEIPAELERIKNLPFFQGLERANFEEQLPKLTEDVEIERVLLQLTVDANDKVKSVEGEFEVSGKDEAGVPHRVTIGGGGDLSGINATMPDVYDPSGKAIEIIDAATLDDRQ